MRFAIAASILAQVLPSAATEAINPKKILADFHTNAKNRRQQQQKKKDEWQIRAADSLYQRHGSGNHDFDSSETRNNHGRLMNNKFRVLAETNVDGSVDIHNKECDPGTGTESERSFYKQEADIGILTCGEHEYCMESEYATFGGFCIPGNSNSIAQGRRRQEQYHGHEGSWNHNHHHLDNFDGDEIYKQQRIMQDSEPVRSCNYRETRYHDITCETELQCLSNCANETCFSSRSEDFGDSNMYYVIYVSGYSICFYVTEPFETKICHSYVKSGDLYTSRDLHETVCHVTYGDTECDLCFADEDKCLFFDCRNVDGPYGQGSIGSTCDENGT